MSHERQLRQLSNSLPQLIWTSDDDGRCDFLSDQWLAYTGAGDDARLGDSWMQQLHPDDRAPMAAAWQAAVAAGAELRGEARLRRHDGVYRWFDVRAVRLCGDDGRTLRWFGSNTDVTDRKERAALASAHQAVADNGETRPTEPGPLHDRLQAQDGEREPAATDLRAGERLYRTMFEAAREGIWLLDATAHTSFVNRRMCELLGYASEEMAGRHLFEFMDPAARAQAASNLERRAAGLAEDHEFRFVRKDGSELWTICSTTPLYDDGGGYTGALAMVLDISERKRDETVIRAHRDMLEGVTRVQRQFLLDDDPRHWFDRVLELLLDTTGSEYGFIAEVVRQPDGTPYLRSLALTNIAWDEQTRAFYQQTLRTGMEFRNLDTLFGAVLTTGATVIANDAVHDPRRGGIPRGHPPLLTFLGIPIFQGEQMNSVVGLANRVGGYDQALIDQLAPVMATCSSLVVARQLELHRRATEAEHRKLEAQMLETQKLESLGVLAGGIAHDFNNILTSIIGNASIGLQLVRPGEVIEECLADIVEAAQRAADLCRQMLAYSGKGRFVVRALDLGQLVESTTQMLQLSISKKATLRFQLARGLPPVEVDATQIRQVIMNLIINASEAITGERGIINLTTGLVRVDRAYLATTANAADLPVGDYVFLEVSDTGAGMTAETKARVFEPFFTTKFTGRGLGLAAVLGIVRGHKGSVKVYSEPGRGSTFKILLPAASRAADDITTTGEAPTAWQGAGMALVVDDEDGVRSTAGRMLRLLGFDVVVAADGDEAIARLAEGPGRFALVLLDLTMPGKDGAQTFAALRALQPGVRVVLMSGFTEEDALSSFTGKGLASFLQKPFSLDSLTDVLRRVLAAAQMTS